MSRAPIALATYSEIDPNKEYVCPYDPVHIITGKRFPIHLTKCRKNHNAKDFVRCPFNARHEIPRPELQYHIATCPDKEIIRQDMDKSSTPQVSVSSNRPRTPPPSQGLMHEHEEDWDAEESEGGVFIPANAHKFDDADKVDSYAVLQTMHEIQNELHATSREPKVDISQMTPAQRKNYKRSLKRAQKRAEEGEEEEPQMTEQERINKIVQKHQLVVDGGGFVDFISGLNIYCQQHKINIPTYQEGPGVKGGFGYKCIVKTSVYATNKYCRSKKEAKQNAAMVAMLALDIQFDAGPLPNRKHTPLIGKEKERMRQTQEQKLLLQSNQKRAGAQQAQPVLQPPSTFTLPPGNSNVTSVNHAPRPPPGFHNIEEPLDNLSLQSQEPEDDGWTTVPSKKNTAKGVNPVFEYSMKIAGRGRGRGARS